MHDPQGDGQGQERVEGDLGDRKVALAMRYSLVPRLPMGDTHTRGKYRTYEDAVMITRREWLEAKGKLSPLCAPEARELAALAKAGKYIADAVSPPGPNDRYENAA